MTTYEAVDVYIGSRFLTWTLVWDEWSASRSGRFTPSTHWIWGWVVPRTSLAGVEKRKFLTLPGLELRPLGRPALSQSLYRLRYVTERKVTMQRPVNAAIAEEVFSVWFAYTHCWAIDAFSVSPPRGYVSGIELNQIRMKRIKTRTRMERVLGGHLFWVVIDCDKNECKRRR
jgi:hypothetical protein